MRSGDKESLYGNGEKVGEIGEIAYTADAWSSGHIGQRNTIDQNKIDNPSTRPLRCFNKQGEASYIPNLPSYRMIQGPFHLQGTLSLFLENDLGKIENIILSEGGAL